MKKNLFFCIAIVCTMAFISCASAPQTTSKSSKFESETQLLVAVPLRFYTWINADYVKIIQKDYSKGYLNFDYDSEGEYLFKIESLDKEMNVIWGKQLVLQGMDERKIIFTQFIPAAYALRDGKDPFDISFEVLQQILNEPMYSGYENSLIDVIRNGIVQYRIGGDAWKAYKADHFAISGTSIILR
jgi:hypothetical protein